LISEALIEYCYWRFG